jgi:phospholipase/carboxylesterase
MSGLTNARQSLHQGQPVLAAGGPLDRAKAAMIMVHGRGASAANILGLSQDLDRPGFAYIAPQAAGSAWYPYPFMQPIAQNEPWLSSALAVLDDLLAHIAAAGIPPERTILLGFSQGACLSSEYVARHARRYGGLAVLSGGVIGPDGTPRDYPGSLDGTPIFLGCSDVDPHIPKTRVGLSAELFRQLGGAVEERIYPRMAHTINEDEITYVQAMIDAIAGPDVK